MLSHSCVNIHPTEYVLDFPRYRSSKDLKELKWPSSPRVPRDHWYWHHLIHLWTMRDMWP